ncbi:hypothetical protein Caci_7310 [Catenulispora acidiphila DSM 44928]|uniref:DUF3892 domain-containing protein n=1 Tax=Catenulispora acidiphila (strain DSM 44928 / JCM 14897 / NBRC 102108 / NRRL B-24433 / ID139908) TaxID=479433 RepID=C7Q8F1_CATAD|nr:hypothetical protein Caci_7310 [Catenulispora acidiphila DSM 44928]
MNTVRMTHKRLAGGSGHEHIVRLWWTDAANRVGDNSTAEFVGWIEAKTVAAYVQDSYGNRVSVGVVTPQFGAKYLRTRADGKWTDNLLALPNE